MNPTLHNEPGLQKRDGEACFGSSTFTAFTDRPPPPVSSQLLVTPKHRRQREIPYFLLLLRGGHPRVSLNAWKKNSFILATTANICHPAQAQRSHPRGPLAGPHVPGILQQHRPPPRPRSPNVRDSAPRLLRSRLPHPHAHRRGPQDHIVRHNTMECHCPELLGGPLGPPARVPSFPDRRVQPVTQTSPCGSPGRGGDGDPRLPPKPPFYPRSPDANPTSGAPTHPETTPQELAAASPGRVRATRRAGGGSPPTRTLGGCCTGAKAPNASPAFPGPPGPPATHSPYLALRLGLLPPLPLLLEAAAAARGS